MTLPAPTARSIPTLLLGLIDRPQATFQHISRGAKWIWIVPFFLLVVTQILYMMVVTEPALAQQRLVMEYTLSQGAFADQVPDDERAAMIEQSVAQGRNPAVLGVGVAAAILAGVGSWVIYGFAFHGLVSLLDSRTSTISGMIVMVSWAWLPLWLRQVVQGVFVWQSNQLPSPAAFSLAALVSSGNMIRDSFNPVFVFLATIDLWQVLNWWLLTAGVAAVATIGRGRALVLVLVIWLTLSVISVAPILLSQRMMGL